MTGAWTEQYGPIYKWKLANLDVVVVTDPDAVAKICSKEGSMAKSSIFYKGLNEVCCSAHVLSSSHAVY